MKQLTMDKLEQCKFAFSTIGCLLTTLAWSRKIVRKSRPILYLADGLMVSCAFVTALWVV